MEGKLYSGGFQRVWRVDFTQGVFKERGGQALLRGFSEGRLYSGGFQGVWRAGFTQGVWRTPQIFNLIAKFFFLFELHTASILALWHFILPSQKLVYYSIQFIKTLLTLSAGSSSLVSSVR